MKKLLISSALLVLCTGALAGSLSVAVVDKEGKPVPDAIVRVFPSDKSAQPKTALPAQATITQEKMQFLPNVTLVPVGAKLSFINNDPWDHHVRSSPAGLGQFNATQAGFELRLEGKSAGKPSKPAEVTLPKAGALSATLLGCFIHGSMRGYVYASETPWAAKTSAEGLAVFDDLPEGAAQVKVWQADQLIDLAPQSFSVSALPGKLGMQLGVVPRRRRS
ncbi:plastocyanin [Polaromonas sp.]|uniref:plastocyanin n=1 Tax=Polaromonas sp. TaxID=1869339 RepID=UPI0013BB0C7F|nr:plastocyanin [Polaromonas sp.]NDP61868.1 plastocyanin [Polaromonas sp.]